MPPNLYYREFDFDFIRGMMQEMKDEYKVEYTEEPDKSLKYPRQRIYTQLHADMTEVSKMLKLSNEKHYERVKKHLDACNRLPVETRDGKNNLLRAILTQCYLPPTYNVEMFRHQICGFMAEFGYFFFPQMEEYLKRKKISYCKYLEKVFNGDIWADEYMLGAVAKMWNIRINVVSPSYKDVWEVFHDGGDPHVVVISNGHDFGKADGVSHFTATRGKVKNWQCVTPTSGKKTEIGQYKGYKKGVVTAVELFQQIEKRLLIEKAELFTTELNDMCEIISSLSIRRDKLLATMETMNMEVDYLKRFKRYEITEIDSKVHPKVGPLIRARDEFLSSPRLQIPKIKVHRSSKTCGKSFIQEAEGEINEILHEIKKKERKNVKDLKSNTPEKKQENEYSQRSNTELRSDEPGVINIREMAVSSEEKEHDVIGEETDYDLIQLDEYSGKISNEQTNIEQYLVNENVIRNIEQKPEQSEEITFQHASKYGELESNASDDTQIVVDGITFDKSAFDMLQSLVPEEQLVEVHMQTDHDYARNVQLTAKNIVVDQPKVNTNLPRVHQYENSQLTIVENIIVDQPKGNVDLPITHQYGNSVQTVTENVVVDQPKMNVNLSSRHKNGNSAQPSMRNVTDQDEINVNSPKTHQYGRIPTKDMVFKPKRARVLLPTRGKSIEHVQPVTHGPEELSVYMPMEDTGQMKQSTRKRHIDDNVAVTTTSNLQSTSTKTSSKKYVCKFCGKDFVSNSYRHKHEERMCTMNSNRKKIQCPYCEETYKHEQNFRDHISLKHTGVKSHICKVCGAAFIHQNQLARHKQAQHQD